MHWGSLVRSSGLWRKSRQQVTLIAHNSGSGLPLASLDGSNIDSIDTDANLGMHMADEDATSNFSMSNLSIISRSDKRM